MYCQLWWTDGGSNPGPPECKSGALPAELPAHINYGLNPKPATPKTPNPSLLPKNS